MPPHDIQTELDQFLTRYIKSYDPETDDYERPPFAADIKEGKNDPIYNVHPYHTKVPPRSIVPYMLHYTNPGDLVLDPFCGSGMTGVAAQMCADPPADILEQFPELKDRVGPRACILSDLSPAACHIAYNYNTSVEIAALKREFDRIRAAIKEEFDWLYGTEHYEPAVALYDPANVEVSSRLKNPTIAPLHGLLGPGEPTWVLLSRSEVEERLGYSVTLLPRDQNWRDINVAEIEKWVCIPATIQYTIWSDIYRCEGFITIEEPSGKISKRGKYAGKPALIKKRVGRGCGGEIVLWDTALVRETGEVQDVFNCRHCGQAWRKIQLQRSGEKAVEVSYAYHGLADTGKIQKRKRLQRIITRKENLLLLDISKRALPYWFPDDEVDMGREMMQHGLQKRGRMRISDFFFKRQLWALGRLWSEFSRADERVAGALRFLFTSLHGRFSKRTKWHQSRFGQCAMPNNLYIPSLMVENNILELFTNKFSDLECVSAFVGQHAQLIRVHNGSATDVGFIADESVDYIFADPPFGQNIYYADCSLLWEAWLQRFTDESQEIVVSERRSGGKFKELSDYQAQMTHALEEMFRVLKPNRWATIEFNNSDGRVFEAIKKAVSDAGFHIVNMLLLDKEQKSYKQVKGASGDEDVVDKDVLFNIHKPSTAQIEISPGDHDLELQVVDAVRRHLETLPDRMRAEPGKYNDEHRTTATINSMLMNSLIPRGVSVDQLNLPFIERVCARYFRKVGQRWYLRGEAVGGNGGERLLPEIAVTDELTAIDWLRQQLQAKPMLLGELKPLWMRATGLLSAEPSEALVLEDLLSANFWRDPDTNRWREPTADEREKMNDDRSLRVLHDAERFVTGALRRQTTDEERCDWIDVLFRACRAIEDNETGSLPALRGFDRTEGYSLIMRLFHSILRDAVEQQVYSRCEKQARAASQRLKNQVKNGLVTTANSKAELDTTQGKFDFKKMG